MTAPGGLTGSRNVPLNRAPAARTISSPGCAAFSAACKSSPALTVRVAAVMSVCCRHTKTKETTKAATLPDTTLLDTRPASPLINGTRLWLRARLKRPSVLVIKFNATRIQCDISEFRVCGCICDGRRRDCRVGITRGRSGARNFSSRTPAAVSPRVATAARDRSPEAIACGQIRSFRDSRAWRGHHRAR